MNKEQIISPGRMVTHLNFENRRKTIEIMNRPMKFRPLWFHFEPSNIFESQLYRKQTS